MKVYRCSIAGAGLHIPFPCQSQFQLRFEAKASMSMSMSSGGGYDRAGEVKEFDASKMGVKGLVDSGMTSIPRFFVHPPETISDLKPRQGPPVSIPTIDLSSTDHSAVVDQIARASRELGFFQIVNHGIPVGVLDGMVASIKAFHEQPAEVKARFYTRAGGNGVSFLSNIDLLHSKAASWRDTLQVKLGPELPQLQDIPEICREEIVEWNQESKRLGEVLMSLLCQGLGLKGSKLKEMTCSQGRMMVGHYYPSCPQPDLTVGINSHTDPGLLTILLQDHIGGLQIKHRQGGWVDVQPVHGALVINIGDGFQIMSNDEYISVEHRVLANPHPDPRISIAVFFNPTDRESLYGPFPELISPEKPALFRQFDYKDYMTRFFTKELDGKSLVNYYRL